jgi:hypothetical protein
LIINKNNPNDIIVIGMLKNTKIGFRKVFKRDNAIAIKTAAL